MEDLINIGKLIFIFLIVIPFLTVWIMTFISEKIFKSKPDDLTMSLAVILMIMIAFIVLSYTDMAHREFHKISEHNIVALQDNQTFVVSRYSGSSELYYYYMVKRGDSYRSHQARQRYSTIKYTNEEPKLVIHKAKSKIRILGWIFPYGYTTDYRYTFYIPEGSIKEEFEINLK